MEASASRTSSSVSSSGTTTKLRVVIKIGTSSLISNLEDGKTKLNLMHLAAVSDAICALRREGHDVLLVSSGAVGFGCHVLGLSERPADDLPAKQALAAIGQIYLMNKYNSLFDALACKCAQVLLTYENFVDRTQYINARNTMNAILEFGVVPIINENDTVGVQELKADNDRLAAMVANAVGDCDLLFLMTDVGGVYTANPSTNPDAKRIPYVTDLDDLERACNLAEGGSNWGTGGMSAKITAAALATGLGVRAVIMSADDVLKIPSYCADEVAEKERIKLRKSGSKAADLSDQDKVNQDRYSFGTTFERGSDAPRERKRWIRTLHHRGALVVDDGARRAVARHKNLFAVGLKEVRGSFVSNECVSILDMEGNEVAHALVNFTSSELDIIKGMRTEEVMELINREGIIVARENLDVLLEDPDEDLEVDRAVPFDQFDSSVTPTLEESSHSLT